MNNQEKDMLKNNQTILLRAFKSVAYAIITVLVFILAVQFLLFQHTQDGDMSLILGFLMAILVVIFYSTFTILEELRKPRN